MICPVCNSDKAYQGLFGPVECVNSKCKNFSKKQADAMGVVYQTQPHTAPGASTVTYNNSQNISDAQPRPIPLKKLPDASEVFRAFPSAGHGSNISAYTPYTYTAILDSAEQRKWDEFWNHVFSQPTD